MIRPLIYAQRREIEEYLKEKNQGFVTDSTNADTDYTRNYIRNEIMPLLRKVNPALEDSMARTARLHRSDEEYLSNEAEKYLTYDISVLSRLHESILSRVVIRLFAEISKETLPEFHVRTLCRKIYEYNGKADGISFPDSFVATLYRGKLSFEKDKRTKGERCDFDIVAGDGSVFFEENPYALYISFDQNEDIPQTLVNGEIIYKKYTTDYLYFDTIPRVLRIRNRREGDKILSGKMNNSVKRLMSDSCYGREERYSVPFVCDGERILLVPGIALCDDCRHSTEKTQRISITLYKHNTDTGEWYYLNEK